MMNDKYILASFPDDTFPENLSSFQKVREEVRPLRDDEVLIQVLYISIDPVARVWVSGAKTYLPAIKLGGEIPGFCVGKVVATTSELHSKNDLVFGVLSWSSYVIRKAHMVFPIPDDLPKPYQYLSTLGHPGITAFQAIKQEILHLPKNISIVISSAAGATGIAFCQYARALGFTRIVGIAGSEEKCKFVREQLQCLEAVNYKTQNVTNTIKSIFPGGVDIYYDNIGEEMLEQMLLCMKRHSKIILCGATATYANWKNKSGINTLNQAILKSITLKGILYFGENDKLMESVLQMKELATKHNIQGYETILKGIDQLPIALRGVYKGLYKGKTIVDMTSSPAAKL